MEHGPASFSAKHPKITHKLRSRRGVRRSECVIISATSSTESFAGSGLSSAMKLNLHFQSNKQRMDFNRI